MQYLEHLYLSPFLLFTLILSRVSGLIMTAPIFGSREIPMVVRGLLAFALSVLITPTQIGTRIAYPETTINYLVFVGAELVIGVALGLGIMILFSGIQITGQIIAQMSGVSLADVFNPAFDAEVPVFSQILYYVTLAVFVTIGGHRRVLEALLETFASVPVGGSNIPASITESLVALVGQSFTLGIRAGAPAMVALLLATVVMGIISRALPQLNILAVGFGVNSLATFGALILSLGAMAWLFQQHVDPAIELLVASFQTTAALTP